MWLNSRYPYSGIKKDSKTMRRYAEYENNRQWQDVFNRNIAVVSYLFKWGGLPNTCDQLFFEKILLFRAQACIIEDLDIGGFLSLPCTQASAQNLYYDHSYYKAISINYQKSFMALTHYNKDIFEEMKVVNTARGNIRGVVCFDNPMKYSLYETIAIYTDKMVDAMRSIDVVAKQLKTPSLIETDETTKASIHRAIEAIDSNMQAVYVSSNISNKFKDTKPIQTFVNPSTLTALWDHLNNLESKFLTAFGVNNLNTADKKERLLTDEVNSNNESISLNIAYRHEERNHFAENFNYVFPKYNVKCEQRYEFIEKLVNKGGNPEDGSILTNATRGIGNTKL